MKLGALAQGVSLLLLAACEPPRQDGNTGHSYVFDSSVLESGDIVLRYGNGLWSRVFRDLSQHEKRFSHVGIVVLERQAAYVIHASANDFSGEGEVHRDPLADFLESASSFAFYRVQGGPALGDRIAREAASHIGKPFDTRFDLSTAGEIYCSELVWMAVNAAAGQSIIPASVVGGKRCVTIDNCYRGPLLAPVFDSEAADGCKVLAPSPPGG